MSGRPSILLMVADDHRHSAIGAWGIEPVRTPTMDAMIGSGAAFTQNRHMGSLSGAVCMPARAALHTGRDPRRATDGGLWNDTGALRNECVTLGQALRDAGYDTFATGKWHNDGASFNRSFAAGRDLFFGGMCDHDKVPLLQYNPSGAYDRRDGVIGEGFSTELFADAAIDFIHSRGRGDRPFFCHVAFTSPHDPRMAPPPYDAMYDPAGLALPANFRPAHEPDIGDMAIRDEKLAARPRDGEEVRRHIADYYGMISHQDHHMGRIIAALRDAGRLDDTIVVYTGDHGLGVGQHGLMGKQNLYEHSLRVPLILTGPGVPRGRRSDALTHTPDMYPTLCDLAGVAMSATVDAPSLAPLLRGQAEQVRDVACCFYKRFGRSITDGRWKLIRYHHDERTGEGTDAVQLFDLAADPWETADLSQQAGQQARLRELTGKLTAWQERFDDPVLRA